MEDLVRWYTRQLDADAARAEAAPPGPWAIDASGRVAGATGVKVIRSVGGAFDGRVSRWPEAPVVDHVLGNDPERVLREINSKRKLLARYVKAVQAVEELKATRERLGSQGQDPFMTDLDLTSAIHRRDTLHGVVCTLAEVYADRDGHEEGWAS